MPWPPHREGDCRASLPVFRSFGPWAFGFGRECGAGLRLEPQPRPQHPPRTGVEQATGAAGMISLSLRPCQMQQMSHSLCFLRQANAASANRGLLLALAARFSALHSTLAMDFQCPKKWMTSTLKTPTMLSVMASHMRHRSCQRKVRYGPQSSRSNPELHVFSWQYSWANSKECGPKASGHKAASINL